MTDERRAYYRFILQNSLRGLLWLLAIIVFYGLFTYFLPEEWDSYLDRFTDKPGLILSIFLTSETLFGIVPLEFFLFWAKEQASLMVFIGFVFLLSVLSYIGALIAYFVGSRARYVPRIQRITQWESFQSSAQIYRKYGGIVIIIAALTPLPFATISFLSATFEFPLARYLLYSSSRFIRFLISGWIIWTVGDLSNILERIFG